MKQTVYIQGFWDRVDEAVLSSGKSKTWIAEQIGALG